MILRTTNDERLTTDGPGGLRAHPKPPVHPKHPERICWGCDKFCPADDMRCGNGTIRAPHPAELFGDDWDQ